MLAVERLIEVDQVYALILNVFVQNIQIIAKIKLAHRCSSVPGECFAYQPNICYTLNLDIKPQEASLTQRYIDTGGMILAGGASQRLGQNKALIEVQGQPLIQRMTDKLCKLVDEIIIVTNTPEPFRFLGLPLVADVYPGVGTLGGLHAGLAALTTNYGLAVGCDMPFLNLSLLRHLLDQREQYDIVVPRIGDYVEPLHAVYACRCAAALEQHILGGQRRVRVAWQGLNVRYVETAEIEQFDPQHLSFFNVNTPQELARMQAILPGS